MPEAVFRIVSSVTGSTNRQFALLASSGVVEDAGIRARESPMALSPGYDSMGKAVTRVAGCSTNVRV
jgi:hypothetical protein